MFSKFECLKNKLSVEKTIPLTFTSHLVVMVPNCTVKDHNFT